MSDPTFQVHGFKPLPEQLPLPTSDKAQAKASQRDHLFEEDCVRLYIRTPDGKTYIVSINPEGHLELHLREDRLVALPASSNTFQFRGEKDFADFTSPRKP